MNEESPKTLTLTAVADEVGVTRKTLYTMISDGRFPVKPIKGTQPPRWNPDAVAAWKVAQ